MTWNSLKKVRDVCHVPLIASGGAGTMEHFLEAFRDADVDGALAASVFHKQIINIGELKAYLATQGRGDQDMLTKQQCRELDWEKTDGLMPVIVQHAVSGEVLMLGYMNPEALDKNARKRQSDLFLADQAAPVDQRRDLRSLPECGEHCA